MGIRLAQLGLSVVLCAGGQALAADPVAKLGWLAGCWAATDGADPGSGEQWSTAAGGTILGTSRTIKNGKTVAFEFVQIREVEPGKLAYIVQPSGRPATVFTELAASVEGESTFENLANDFPQRVIYKRGTGGVLNAAIEGMSKGKLKRIEFPMRRASCEPAA